MNDAAPPPPPPPPPPPGGGQGPDNDPLKNMGADNPLGAGPQPADFQGSDNSADAPAVASSPGKVFLVLAGIIAFVLFMLFTIFGGDDAPPPTDNSAQQQKDKLADQVAIPEPMQNLDEIIPAPPPPPPMFDSPPLPPEPVELQPLVQDEKEDAAAQAALQARLRSSIMLFSGGEDNPLDATQEEFQPTDPNERFAQRVANQSEVETVASGHIGDLRRVVAQGRVITAVLETAINTDLPGMIRGVVSHDVYPEAGRVKIIPKGSRLIGQYSSEIEQGQQRVMVIWTRVIRPDGVDVMLGSPLTDGLGQAGVEGVVDDKFDELFRRSLLSTLISVSLAIAADEIVGDDADGNGNGGNNTSIIAGADGQQVEPRAAVVNAIQDFGGVIRGYLQRFIDIQPTILVDQGTVVKVFVNKDIHFNANLTNARMIP